MDRQPVLVMPPGMSIACMEAQRRNQNQVNDSMSRCNFTEPHVLINFSYGHEKLPEMNSQVR